MPQPLVELDPRLPTLRPIPADRYRAAADPLAELDRQVAVYLDLGWHDLLGRSESELRSLATPLRSLLPAAAPEHPDGASLVLVVPGIPPNAAVPGMRHGNRSGVSVITDAELGDYQLLPGVPLPNAAAYLLVGVEVGIELRNASPHEAVIALGRRNRTPLTVAEGIALTTVRPDLLRPSKCYSLAAVKAGRRVPAIWISDHRPKLGWCWEGNPHTWLGTASADRRVAPDAAPPPPG